MPGLTAVVSAINVRPQIVDTKTAHGNIRRIIVKMRGADLSDLAPVGQFVRSDVLPFFPAISCRPNQPVIGPRPNRVHIVESGSDCINRASLLPCLWI